MKRFCILLTLAFLPMVSALCGGSPSILVVEDENSQVLLLDQKNAQGDRREVATNVGKPASIIVEHPDAPADQWHEVRWVFRFPLTELQAPVSSAILHLWGQVRTGDTEAPLKLELIESGESIQNRDRSQRSSFDPIVMEYPRKAGMIEVDTTELVNQALERKWHYVTFRISAVSEEMLNELKPGRYYFGGIENEYQWPESHPPTLEIHR